MKFADGGRGGHAPLVPTAFGVFHYPPCGATAPQRPAVFVKLRLDRSIHYANRPWRATIANTVMLRLDRSIHYASQLWIRNAGEALRSSRRATIAKLVMLRLDRSIHYANRRGRCGGGTHAEG